MIRLSLLTTAGIVGAMLIFGTDEPGAAPAPVTEAVLAPVPGPAPKPRIEELVTEVVHTRAEANAETPVFPTFAAPAALRIEAADAPASHAVQQEVADGLLIVTGDVVNLRAGPSTGTDVLGKLRRGTAVTQLGAAADGWLHIRQAGTGIEGYMAARFLDAR